MPTLNHKCDNYHHCHNHTETPGLCPSCQREAKQLTIRVKKDEQVEVVQIKHGKGNNR